MIQMLIGPVAKIASTWMEGRVKKVEAVTRMKVAKAEAEANVMEKKATGEIDWDLTQAEASADSWKDEWLTIIFTLPLVLLLFGEEERVSNFFTCVKFFIPSSDLYIVLNLKILNFFKFFPFLN